MTPGEFCLWLEAAGRAHKTACRNGQTDVTQEFIMMNHQLERSAWLVTCVFCTQGLCMFS